MAESSKKRNGSFKKFLPSFFSKSKNKSKEASLKVNSNVPNSNQYHEPRSVIRSDKSETYDTNRVYENLTTKRQNDNDIQSVDISSDYSSSSTLVSVSVKNKKQHSFSGGEDRQVKYHSARPQVPPKPYCEMHKGNHETTYPDVYYHSLEKLSDKISPMDEIEIYKASQVQANPASVGAEIKRVSTKFLISPKKESEVRTIQPTRARSLSFDRSKENEIRSQTNPKKNVIKAYNYSAPTSPIPINHKIPNMPKTASPYEHVRKNMIETEEKRNNSLSRGSLRKTTPSPGLEYFPPQRCTSVPSNSPIYKDTSLEKEKTLQKVEAFYWQKLKEMKEKEDEYLRQASLRSSLRMNVHHKSNCSSPTLVRVEPKSFSLPRGVELQTYSNQPLYATPFARGTQERRTDTFVKSRSPITEPEIIFRHPEKLFTSPSSQPLQKTPIFHRGSLNRQTSTASQPKRVSFEEQYSKPERFMKSAVTRTTKVTNDIPKPVNQRYECSTNTKVSEMSRVPPRPPTRTTSVGVKTFRLVNNSTIIYSAGTGHSICSESESGSEAGEIQRILQNNTQKDHETHSDNTPPPPAPVPPEVRDRSPSTGPPEPEPDQAITAAPNSPAALAPLPLTSNALQGDPEPLDFELLEALGDATEDNPVYGPDIHSMLAQRWLPILKKGIKSDIKDKLLKDYVVPENCKLLKAPTVNPELRAAVTDTAKNRDKKIQIEQDQLGLGITAINRAMTVLLTQDNKVEAVKILSDGCRILSDLHFTQTQVRKKLLTRGLDKAFLTNIQEQERDETLFGITLPEKIKESKAIEKQGKDIKKTPTPRASTSNAPTQSPALRNRFQGNWSGPPRHQTSRRGGRGSQYRSQYQYRGGPQTFAPPAFPAPPHAAPRPSSSTTTATGSRRAPTRH